MHAACGRNGLQLPCGLPCWRQGRSGLMQWCGVCRSYWTRLAVAAGLPGLANATMPRASPEACSVACTSEDSVAYISRSDVHLCGGSMHAPILVNTKDSVVSSQASLPVKTVCMHCRAQAGAADRCHDPTLVSDKLVAATDCNHVCGDVWHRVMLVSCPGPLACGCMANHRHPSGITPAAYRFFIC